MAFWDLVEKTPTCWLWLGNKSSGYGRAKYQGTKWMAHRLSWVLANGPITGGLLVLHKCDVRACVRPSHLFLGTQQNNIDDMFKKGRANKARGERHGMSKLSDGETLELRMKYDSGQFTQAALAELYGLHPVYVNKLLRGHKRKG